MIARLFRWFPLAFGRKAQPLLVDQWRAVAQSGGIVAPPKQTQAAHLWKLWHSKLKAARERKQA